MGGEEGGGRGRVRCREAFWVVKWELGGGTLGVMGG